MNWHYHDYTQQLTREQPSKGYNVKCPVTSYADSGLLWPGSMVQRLRVKGQKVEVNSQQSRVKNNKKREEKKVLLTLANSG